MSTARYLFPEWFEEVRRALDTVDFTGSERSSPVSFGFVVTEPPASHPEAGSVITYTLVSDPARQVASVIEGSADADVRLTTSYAVALRVATGRQAAGRAFLDGSIRIGGDVAVLLDRATDLERLQGRFPDVSTEDVDA